MPRPRDPSDPARPSGPGVPPGAAGPPRFHSLLLRRVVSGQDADILLGDLEEEYHHFREERGERAAAGWYRTAARDLLCSYLWIRLRHGRTRDRDVLLEARRQRRRSRRWGRSREKDLRMTIQQDVRYAWRTLLRRPGFTLAVVLTIGLGIGATTAIFTVMEGVVLRPLPFPGSERVVLVKETNPLVGSYSVASPPNVADWDRMSRTIEVFGVARSYPYILQGEQGGESVRGATATPGWFTVHGLRAARGRLFTDQDMLPGSNRVVVLGHDWWEQRFGGDPEVVGREIVLDGEPFLVIGVLPADAWIHDFGDAEAWKPLTAIGENTDQRDWRGFVALGRLAEGVTLAQARAEMATIRVTLEETYPEYNEGWGIALQRLRDHIAGPVEPMLWLFLGAVGFVLLIGCVNVANLLLVRATERQQEFAVRASLGAGVTRLVRQLLTESLLLALLGGGLGLLLARWLTDLFLGLAPSGIPRLDEVGLDGTVLVFTLCVTLLTALLFGLTPALRGARTDLNITLRAVRGEDRRTLGLRRGLVVIELALALALLSGAALLGRGFISLLSWDPGFDREDLVTAWALAPRDAYQTADTLNDLFEQVAEGLRALPEVAAVGMTSAGPLFGGRETDHVRIEGREEEAAEDLPSVRWYDIDPGFLETMGMTLLGGRGITARDDRGAPFVGVVNETLADRFWPGGDPLGQRLTLRGSTFEVVGVVSDVRPLRPDEPVWPEIYWPKRQMPRGATYYVLRTRTPLEQLDLAGLERTVRQRAAEVEPDLQLSRFAPFASLESQALVPPRFITLLVGMFALIAVLLASIGIYAVVAFSVAGRTREIAVRLAVGAYPTRITREVVRESLRMVVIGLLIGLAGALVLGRSIAGLLFGADPYDPVALGGALGIFLVVAVLASWLPARRVGRLDPIEALRVE